MPIRAFFENSSRRVWTRYQLYEALQLHRDKDWDVAQSLTVDRFISRLIDRGHLHRVVVAPSAGLGYSGESVRYLWGEASAYEVAASLKTDSYLSHGSAVYLHGLTEQIPKTIYLNKEQADKGARSPNQINMSQGSIDRAFSRPARVSRYALEYDDFRVVLISGKQTRRLEVTEISGPYGESLPVTKLERTLIDVAVRPGYAGGVLEVLRAYETARQHVSVATLVATLKKLDHAYPFHQAIGFYMERAGYEPAQLERLRALGLKFDFYLMNQIKDPAYSRDWRLFHPKGM